MLRNTAAKIGDLRTGDRFYFVTEAKRLAYQVTRIGNKISYNIIEADGKALWPFDKQAAHDRPVIFLRHTVPAPGEECRLYDLQNGDVFCFVNDIVNEFIVLDTKGLDPDEKYLIDTVNESNKRFWKGDTTVFYVGKMVAK